MNAQTSESSTAAVTESGAASGAVGQRGSRATEEVTRRRRAPRAPGAQALRRPPDAAGGVWAAVWCRSVGTCWTLELHELDGALASGTIRDWIGTGVPIGQPAPEALADRLLASRGLRLVRDPSVGPGTRSRRGIGYACADARS